MVSSMVGYRYNEVRFLSDNLTFFVRHGIAKCQSMSYLRERHEVHRYIVQINVEAPFKADRTRHVEKHRSGNAIHAVKRLGCGEAKHRYEPS